MKKFFGKLLAFALVLVMAVGVLPDISEVSAASKPKTPKITVATSDDGASIIITIGKTKNADGYEIAAIMPGSEVFTEIKVLEENGKKKRTFTAGNLPGGTYSIKVRGYKNSNDNKVWGQYSTVQDVTLTSTQKEEAVESAGFKVGDIITFGAYEQDGNWDNGKEPIEWIILSNDDSEIYIVSRYVLLAGVINPFEKGKNVTWENCSLREYLNSEFINESFSDEEAAVISETELSDAGTADRVFLLAEDDVKLNDAIFLRDMDRRCSPTEFAYKFDKSMDLQY